MNHTKLNIDNIKKTFSGRYKIEAKIGEGGFSLVYRARHIQTNHLCALKILKPELNADAWVVKKFYQEIKIGATLNHPNILRIYFGGEIKGFHFMEMELLNGLDLSKLIKRRGPLNQYKIASIGLAVASALAYIHKKPRIVHRDIKTSNIFMDGNRPVLTDFGIACNYPNDSDGNGMLTIEYISPEQAMNFDNIHPQNDLYSLGVVMYECLTGRIPFKGKTTKETLQKIKSEKHIPVRRFNKLVSGKMESIINSLLEKKKENRIQSAKTLRDLLNGIYKQRNTVTSVFYPTKNAIVKTTYTHTGYTLRQLNGKSPGKNYKVIGRKKNNLVFSVIGRYHKDWVIPDVDIHGEKIISRQHVELAINNGQTGIRHLYSENKSFIGGKEMEPGVFYPVSKKTQLRLGNIDFELLKRKTTYSINMLGVIIVVVATVFMLLLMAYLS